MGLVSELGLFTYLCCCVGLWACSLDLARLGCFVGVGLCCLLGLGLLWFGVCCLVWLVGDAVAVCWWLFWIWFTLMVVSE